MCRLLLHEAEHESLGGDYAEEHGERVDSGVGHGRCVAAGGVVGVGQGWGVCVSARDRKSVV